MSVTPESSSTRVMLNPTGSRRLLSPFTPTAWLIGACHSSTSFPYLLSFLGVVARTPTSSLPHRIHCASTLSRVCIAIFRFRFFRSCSFSTPVPVPGTDLRILGYYGILWDYLCIFSDSLDSTILILLNWRSKKNANVSSRNFPCIYSKVNVAFFRYLYLVIPRVFSWISYIGWPKGFVPKRFLNFSRLNWDKIQYKSIWFANCYHNKLSKMVLHLKFGPLVHKLHGL